MDLQMRKIRCVNYIIMHIFLKPVTIVCGSQLCSNLVTYGHTLYLWALCMYIDMYVHLYVAMHLYNVCTV